MIHAFPQKSGCQKLDLLSFGGTKGLKDTAQDNTSTSHDVGCAVDEPLEDSNGRSKDSINNIFKWSCKDSCQGQPCSRPRSCRSTIHRGIDP